jgi:signal transduction histidine kinase
MLHEFISTHRDKIIERTQRKIALRAAPRATDEELSNGVPLFLTQLSTILEQEAAKAAPDGAALGASATQHGSALLKHGFSIAQVVHDYGDICQAITELAVDLEVPIATEHFQTLNRCLDDAIANAVTEYARQRDVDMSGAQTQRHGFLAHELRNHVHTAMLAFQAVKSGRVGVTGSTVEVLERSLRGLRSLIDRSLSEVRLQSRTHMKERLRVADFVEEMEIDASMDATDRGLRFSVESVDNDLRVDVDRQLFGSAVSNLLQNAFKFTRRAGHVWLRTRSTATTLYIEVEDQCGGLAPGLAELLFRPFERHGPERSGLGLGLAISRQAIESDGGKISLKDIPGKGCVFTVEMPLASANAAAG